MIKLLIKKIGVIFISYTYLFIFSCDEKHSFEKKRPLNIKNLGSPSNLRFANDSIVVFFDKIKSKLYTISINNFKATEITLDEIITKKRYNNLVLNSLDSIQISHDSVFNNFDLNSRLRIHGLYASKDRIYCYITIPYNKRIKNYEYKGKKVNALKKTYFNTLFVLNNDLEVIQYFSLINFKNEKLTYHLPRNFVVINQNKILAPLSYINKNKFPNDSLSGFSIYNFRKKEKFDSHEILKLSKKDFMINKANSNHLYLKPIFIDDSNCFILKSKIIRYNVNNPDKTNLVINFDRFFSKKKYLLDYSEYNRDEFILQKDYTDRRFKIYSIRNSAKPILEFEFDKYYQPNLYKGKVYVLQKIDKENKINILVSDLINNTLF